jgi:hypothetical protein
MRNILTLALAATLCAVAHADDSAVLRCRAITDAGARLSCYDAIPLGGTTAPAVPAARAASPAAAFGLESRAMPTQSLVPSIESAIEGPFDGWLPRTQFKLANGQVWEISDGSQAAYDLRNPKVRITRGVSGSFFIAIEGVAQTPRVRRIR